MWMNLILKKGEKIVVGKMMEKAVDVQLVSIYKEWVLSNLG